MCWTFFKRVAGRQGLFELDDDLACNIAAVDSGLALKLPMQPGRQFNKQPPGPRRAGPPRPRGSRARYWGSLEMPPLGLETHFPKAGTLSSRQNCESYVRNPTQMVKKF